MAAQPTPVGYPRGAYLLSIIGGVFVLFGAYTVAGGVPIGPEIPFTAVILGIAIIIVGYQFKPRPQSAKAWGATVLVLSLLSYLGGAGFLIGLVLGVIGGVLGLAWKAPVPVPGYGPLSPPGSRRAGPPTASQVSPGIPVGRRFCTRCGAPNIAGAKFCARCGSPLSG